MPAIRPRSTREGGFKSRYPMARTNPSSLVRIEKPAASGLFFWEIFAVEAKKQLDPNSKKSFRQPTLSSKLPGLPRRIRNCRKGCQDPLDSGLMEIDQRISLVNKTLTAGNGAQWFFGGHRLTEGFP
jgi:hypothetical protein